MSRPSAEDYVLITRKKDSFRQAFHRYRARFQAGLKLDPRGLRRTLVKEFTMRSLYGPALQLYRGHKPEIFSDLDWENYLDRLEYDAEGVIRMFQGGVIQPLNEMLREPREQWNRGSNEITFSA